MHRPSMSRVKAAELLSVLGAAFLGAGLALLWADKLGSFAVPILVGGAVAHTLGMAVKHRLERGQSQPAWVRTLYWVCWITLAGLGVLVMFR